MVIPRISELNAQSDSEEGETTSTKEQRRKTLKPDFKKTMAEAGEANRNLT
jgi:hypothetical protein